jgi:hypothetical protein
MSGRKAGAGEVGRVGGAALLSVSVVGRCDVIVAYSRSRAPLLLHVVLHKPWRDVTLARRWAI